MITQMIQTNFLCNSSAYSANPEVFEELELSLKHYITKKLGINFPEERN